MIPESPEAEVGIVEREPVRTAGAGTAGISIVIAAMYLIARDLGLEIPPDTQAALTAAAMVLVGLIAYGLNELARARATPTARPVLPNGTNVTTPSGGASMVRSSPATP